MFIASAGQAGIVLTPEQPVATPGSESSEGEVLATATDGAGFLVFWRRDVGVFVSRVSAEGAFLNVAPQEPIIEGYTKGVTACWTGSSYLLVWGGVDGFNHAMTLSRDGKSLGPAHTLMEAAPAMVQAVVSNGRRVVLQYYDTYYSQRLALLDTDGTLISPDLQLPLGDMARVTTPPWEIATDGRDFALFWGSGGSESIELHKLDFDDEGRVLRRPASLGNFAEVWYIDVAYGAGQYALSVELYQGSISKTRLAIIDAATNAVTRVSTYDIWFLVAWNGTNFVGYTHENGFSPVLRTMLFRGGSDVPVSRQFPRTWIIGWNANRFLAMREDRSVRELSVMLLDHDAAAVVSQPVQLSFRPTNQLLATVATSGDESLVVWVDTTDGQRLVAARVSASGQTLDPVPLEIGAGVAVQPLAVVFTGSAYLVCWTGVKVEQMYARHIGRDGSLGPVTPLGPGYGISLASRGGRTLMVFTDGGVVRGYRFNAQAELADSSPFPIASGVLGSVATNGTDFFVAWHSLPADQLDLYGARVSAAGVVGAPALIGAGPSFIGAVGSDGRDYFVFYTSQKVQTKYPLTMKNVSSGAELVVADDVMMVISIADGPAGFWLNWSTRNEQSTVLAHVSGQTVETAVLPTDHTPLTLAAMPGGGVRMAYCRQLYGAARAVIRQAEVVSKPRSRAARH